MTPGEALRRAGLALKEFRDPANPDEVRLVCWGEYRAYTEASEQ